MNPVTYPKIFIFIYFLSNFFFNTHSMAQDINLGAAGVIEESAGATPNLTRPFYAAVSGNYAYVVTGSDVLEIIDITIPGLPKHKGNLANGDGGAVISGPRSMFVSGNFAYIANFNGNSVEIVDILDPSSPFHRSTITKSSSTPFLSNPNGIYVLGNYAYVVSFSGGLDIFDISNPSNPVYKSTLLNGGNVKLSGATSIFVALVKNELHAFITAANSNAIEIVNVNDPSSPRHVSSLVDPVNLVYPSSIYVANNNAFVTSVGSSTLCKIRISDPANAKLLITIKNPPAPTTKDYLTRPWACTVSKGNAYAVAESGGLIIADTANLNLKSAASYTELSGGGNYNKAIIVQGNYAYVTSQINNSLVVLDISNPSLAQPLSIKATINTQGGVILNNPVSVFVSNDLAYVANRNVTTLQIINVKNPTAPVGVASFSNLTNYPNSVFVLDKYAYVVSATSLEIIDVTNPYFPTRVGLLTNGQGGAALSGANSISVANVSGKLFAFIASSTSNALEIVNVTDPKTPVHSIAVLDGNGSAPYLSGASHVTVYDNKAYVISRGTYAGKTGALEILDVSNISSPTHLGAVLGVGSNLRRVDSSTNPITNIISTGGNNLSVVKNGASTFVYMVDATSTNSLLQVVDVTNPLAMPAAIAVPLKPDPFGSVAWPTGISIFNSYALVPYYGGGIQLFDISSPLSPKWISSFVNGSNGVLLDQPSASFIAGNYCFVTNVGRASTVAVTDMFAPSITGFSPVTASPGTSVTLSGKNFSTFLTASINRVPVPITSVTNTALTITLPQVGIGKIVLKQSNQILSTASNLVVIPVSNPGSSITQSGYTASWSDVGATKYFIDVSTSATFSSFVSGYTNQDVGYVTSFALTGLTPGTTYYYRVRSTDGSNSSGNSNMVITKTTPATPVINAATSIKQNTFSFSWGAVTSATSYYVDVAIDNAFTSLLGNYNNLVTNATSININALDPGVTYYYRVRSANASGNSPSSSSLSTSTIPANPTATDATAISTSGFTANWSDAAGATEYFIDISTDNFATFVSGFSNLSAGASTSFKATLPSGTSYQYRVRASNSSGKSDNSNSILILTLTPTPTTQPSDIVFSSITANSVNISFSKAANEPAGYLVLRSISSVFVSPANGISYTIGASIGNANVAYVGSALSFFDGGLPTSLKYFYSIYSFNGNGIATNYNNDRPLQGNVTLDLEPPVLTAPSVANPSTITAGNTPAFNINITDNVKVAAAKIYYRGISQRDFKNAPLNSSASGSNYSVQIQTNWYDSLGVEYYFMATDESGNTNSRPVSSFAQIVNASISLPALPSGTGEEDYRIVAFPYKLSTDNNVTSVYSNVPWGDNTKSGLWWWNPSLKNNAGDYDHYGESSTLKTVDPGKGYWAITSTPVTPTLSNVSAPKYNRSNLYAMTLKPGWNQVGNPYPMPVSWDQVIAYNQANNPGASFGSLTIYDGKGYKAATGSTLLAAFAGGFVKNLSSSDINIQIPFPGQLTIGGRVAAVSSDISQDNWNISLHINQNGRVNQLGGFGMHQLAQSGVDRFDNFNPPSFLGVPEVSFINSDFPSVTFSNDMVASQENYTWTFTPNGKNGSVTQLTWNNELNTNSSKQLFLLDEELLTVVDMNSVSQYDFVLTKSSRFRIFYGNNVIITTSRVVASAPFPNPLNSESKSTINIALPESGSDYSINMQVYNTQGSVIGSVNRRLSPGIHPLEFILSSSLAEGIYLYKLAVTNDKTSSIHTGKIVKP